MSHRERLNISPNASSLAKSLRSIGYSFNDAVCDIVDNSLTASASIIDIDIAWADCRPKVIIKDNGIGMSRNELIEAMRPGTRSPAEKRADGDLGRFGLGLKTASFSQSSKLAVTTWQEGRIGHTAEWDLDEVERANEWLLTLEEVDSHVTSDSSGTIVEWQRMDAFLNVSETEAQDQLARIVVSLESHVGRTYHRFIEGAVGKTVNFVINGMSCKPRNPFFISKSTCRPKETITDNKKVYEIQSYTLPHSSKCSKSEWEENSGPNGYLDSQGFYLYRNNRLIVAGSWFGLSSKKESTKLCRASIDISQEADFDWQIDIKKSSATPPPAIRARLKSLVSNLSSTSRQVQLHRSRSLSSTDVLSLWKRVVKDGSVEYVVDTENHLVRSLTAGLSEEQRTNVVELVSIITNTLPTRAIYRDLCDDSASITQPDLELSMLIKHAIEMKRYLETTGRTQENIHRILKNAEMFRLRWKEIENLI